MIEYVLGAGALAVFAAFMGMLTWRSLSLRRFVRRQFSEWSAIAEPLGFRVEKWKYGARITGLVAARPFEVDHDNFITYGREVRLGMRIKFPHSPARLWISADKQDESPGTKWFGPVLAPIGDSRFDAVFVTRGNDAGRRILERLSIDARNILLDNPTLTLYWQEKGALIELDDSKLTASSLDAVHRLMAGLIAASEETGRA